MNITTQERIDLLVDLEITMTNYSDSNGSNWRPALQDYATYHTLLNLYEGDMSDMQPEYLWRKKPDEIMTEIINSNRLFVIDTGWEDLYEDVREWATEKGFVVHCDELDEEEYQQLMEAK